MNKFVYFLAIITLTSCGTEVTITDSTWCGDLGSQGASCFHILTTQEQDIPKALWDVQRFGMICTNASVFAKWKQDLEELCSYSKDCDYAAIQSVTKMLSKVSTWKKRWKKNHYKEEYPLQWR